VSIKRKVLAVVATLTVAGGVTATGTLPAGAATAACGQACISIFSHELGTYAQPNFVEAVLQGTAMVGQPVILKEPSGSDPSEDLLNRPGPHVSDFYAAGMVSAEVNSHYGNLVAAQIEYAPSGMGTGLCVGLATVAYQNEGLTLLPCSVPATTVWIIDFPDSPATAADRIFPIVNASTTDFSRPFAMSLRQDEIASDVRTLQIEVRRLQFRSGEHLLPDTQLWGALFGPLS
jgi:hypothetical protein